MATTTVAHASLIRYDSDGNQLVINLKNTGDDVSISRSSNGNLPAGATTAQGLANSLGALAFKNSLSKADVGLENVDNTADSAKSVNYANTAGAATKATHVVDYNNTGVTIDIGYKGSGITGDAIKYIAGYTTGANGSTARIKDVSKSALISWMEVLPGDSIFYVSKEAPSVPCIWAKID